MIAALFPGQGSQKPGMGKSLFDNFSVSRDVFEEVSTATGLDLGTICFESNEETLRQTDNAQMALFTCGVAAYRAYAESGAQIERFAGHSVGEYAALVCGGVVSLADGARLVKRRGELMASAGSVAPGTMAAVLGLEIEAIEKVLSEVEGIVVVANDNCPGQVVISGEVGAVTEAGPKLQAAGAKRVLPLNVSGAFHSPLMQTPSQEFAQSLSEVTFGSGLVYSNVLAAVVEDPSRWATLLEEQLRGRVRWTELTQQMVSDGVTSAIEFGGGEVLCGMLKRIDKSVSTRSVGEAESITS